MQKAGAKEVRTRWVISTTTSEEGSTTIKARATADPTRANLEWDPSRHPRAASTSLMTLLTTLAMHSGEQTEIRSADVKRAYLRSRVPAMFKNKAYITIFGIPYAIIGGLYGLMWAAMLWFLTFDIMITSMRWKNPEGKERQFRSSAASPTLYTTDTGPIGTAVVIADDMLTLMPKGETKNMLDSLAKQTDLHLSEEGSASVTFNGYEITRGKDGGFTVTCTRLQERLRQKLEKMEICRDEHTPMAVDGLPAQPRSDEREDGPPDIPVSPGRGCSDLSQDRTDVELRG